MVYASITDAIALRGADYVTVSCDRDRDGVLDTEAFELALQAASNKVDGYFMGRVRGWPWAVVPALVRQYTVDLAIYDACTDPSVLTEIKKDRYHEAIEYLDAVAKGRIKLTTDESESGGANLAQSSTTVTASRASSLMSSCARVFTREKLRHF
jgi:phage gp36-like protein